MKVISTSYVNTPEYTDPEKWLNRIRFYTGLLEELAKDYEVESIEQINYEGHLKQNGVIYHFLNFKKKRLYFPFKLHRHLKNLKPDIVFVNGFIFPFQIIQLKRALGQQVKIIVLHRAEKPYSGIKRYLQKIADRSVDAYLFVSAEFGDQWVKKGIIKHKNKIHEVIQASSSFKAGDKIAAKRQLKIEGYPIFLWVGRLDENKDPLTVIKAFMDYLVFQQKAKLFMIFQGDELLSEVRKVINDDIKSREAIVLVGKVEHPHLENWFNAADFFISGSHYEGSGIATSEAMSCGCIPVLTDIISFRKMTGPGRCGFLYKPGSTAQLLSALLKTNEINIEAEKQKTLTQFRNELSFPAVAQKITRVINSLA